MVTFLLPPCVNLLLPKHCSSEEAILPALLGLRGSSELSLPLKLLLRLLLLLKLPCEPASLLLLLRSLSLLLRRVLLPETLRALLLVRRLPVVLFAPGSWYSSAMWLWPVCAKMQQQQQQPGVGAHCRCLRNAYEASPLHDKTVCSKPCQAHLEQPAVRQKQHNTARNAQLEAWQGRRINSTRRSAPETDSAGLSWLSPQAAQAGPSCAAPSLAQALRPAQPAQQLPAAPSPG